MTTEQFAIADIKHCDRCDCATPIPSWPGGERWCEGPTFDARQTHARTPRFNNRTH